MHHTPLDVCSFAIRTCWQSFKNSDGGGDRDRELIDRVGNRYRHSSTLEHLSYTFLYYVGRLAGAFTWQGVWSRH